MKEMKMGCYTNSKKPSKMGTGRQRPVDQLRRWAGLLEMVVVQAM